MRDLLTKARFATVESLRSEATAYLYAAVLMAVALAATLHFTSLTDRVPYVFVATTVVVVAMSAGVGPCLLAAVIGALGTQIGFHPPLSSVIAFLGVSGLVAGLSSRNKRSEEGLRRQAMIFANLIDAIIITDTRRRIVDANPIAEKMYGYTKRELIGKHASVLQKPEDVASVSEKIEGGIESEGVWSGEVDFVRKDGTVGVCDLTILAIRDHKGRVVGTAGINREITERKQLEQQLRQAQKMEAIGRLAGGIAHDFNNILTAVIGYSDLLLMGLGESDPNRTGLLEIQKAGHRAAGLTRQLLAFSRRQMLQPQAVNLNDILSEIETMLRRLIGEDIELAIVRDPGIGTVRADRGQLQQVVMNLVINARDAMPNGGRLTIRTENIRFSPDHSFAEDSGGDFSHALLVVEDTGIGIDEENLDKIFEPFFTTKEPAKGTGLGLSTVYGIIKQSGGELRVSSHVDNGARFEIFLPLVRLEPSIVQESNASIAMHDRFETVLVIEDEAPVRTLVKAVLRTEGYQVLDASDGNEAINMIRDYTGPLDLVLTDVVMPGLNGMETVDRLLEIRPELPVVFMSGYMDYPGSPTGILNLGAPFIAKPFTPAALIKKVGEVLNREGDSNDSAIHSAPPAESASIANKL